MPDTAIIENQLESKPDGMVRIMQYFDLDDCLKLPVHGLENECSTYSREQRRVWTTYILFVIHSFALSHIVWWRSAVHILITEGLFVDPNVMGLLDRALNPIASSVPP